MINYAVILFIAIFAACSSNRGPMVAEVNGNPIYASDITRTMEMEKDKYDPVLMTIPENENQLKHAALELQIQEKLLLNEAKKLGITVSKSELQANLEQNFGTKNTSKIKSLLEERGIDPSFWMNYQERKLIISKLINKEVFEKIPVSDEQIKEFYSKGEFRRPMQYRARQILVDSKEKADELLKQLKAGADFDELARENSISPDAERGGDLGFFSIKDFPQVFSEICAQLKKNEISSVKKTPYGFQIFQLTDTRPAKTLSLEEVKDGIIEFIRDEQSVDYFAEWMKNMRSQSHIIINDKALEEVNLNVESKKM